MRRIGDEDKRRRLLEDVRRMMEGGVSADRGAARSTADLRAPDGRRKWVWVVSRFGGPEAQRVREDVFDGPNA